MQLNSIDRRRFFLWLIVVTVGVTTIAVIALKWRTFRTADPDAGILQLADEGARLYASFDSVSLREADVAELLANAPMLAGGELVSEARRRQLLQLVEEFLMLYYDATGPDSYMAWRESRGDQLMSVQEMRSDSLIPRVYQSLHAGEPIPVDASGESIFRSIWGRYRTLNDSANAPTRIITSREGMFLRFKLLTAADPLPPTLPEEMIGVWLGGISMGSNDLWKSPTDLGKAFAEHEQVLAGYVTLLLEFEDASRRPFTWACFWSPVEQRWRLIVILQNNVLKDGSRPPIL